MRVGIVFGAVVALVCVAAASAAAPVQTTCAKYDVLSVAGDKYRYQQDEWNSDLRQCARVQGPSFRLTTGAFALPTNGPPATYPSFYTGCHWGNCAGVANGMPKRVSKVRSIRSSWSTVQPATGAYDVSYDVWTSTTPHTSGQPDGSEVMIWLASRGGVQPGGSKIGTVKLAGTTWEVWSGRGSTWNLISYRRVTPTTAVRDLDVTAFLHDSVKRGLTKPGWFLIDGEAGFEIWQGGKGLATTSFSFDVK
jgi:cellulose 1,4-beta-cellobiosidase